MNTSNDLKTAWEIFYSKVQEFLTAQETNLSERENTLDRKLAEAKLIEIEGKKLVEKKHEIDFEKDILTKAQTALREKQTMLEAMEVKLRAKSARLQSLLSEEA